MSGLTYDESCALLRGSDITTHSAVLAKDDDVELDAFSAVSHALSIGESDNPEFILINAEQDDIWTDVI